MISQNVTQQNKTEIEVPNNTIEQDFDRLNRNGTKQLDKIKGFTIVTTVKPVHKPKSFKESRLIWNDSGTRKYCEYDYISNEWYYITMTLVT